jgi:hypothetical protein
MGLGRAEGGHRVGSEIVGRSLKNGGKSCWVPFAKSKASYCIEEGILLRDVSVSLTDSWSSNEREVRRRGLISARCVTVKDQMVQGLFPVAEMCMLSQSCPWTRVLHSMRSEM